MSSAGFCRAAQTSSRCQQGCLRCTAIARGPGCQAFCQPADMAPDQSTDRLARLASGQHLLPKIQISTCKDSIKCADTGLRALMGMTPSCGTDCSASPQLAATYILMNLCYNVSVLTLLRTAGAHTARLCLVHSADISSMGSLMVSHLLLGVECTAAKPGLAGACACRPSVLPTASVESRSTICFGIWSAGQGGSLDQPTRMTAHWPSACCRCVYALSMSCLQLRSSQHSTSPSRPYCLHPHCSQSSAARWVHMSQAMCPCHWHPQC